MSKVIILNLLLLICLLTKSVPSNCQDKFGFPFKIIGSIDMKDNEEIKLEYFNNTGELIKLTALVNKKFFEIIGILDDSSAILGKLYGSVESRDDGDPNSINFFLEPGTIFINLNVGFFKKAIINGSESEQIHRNYLKLLENERSENNTDSLGKYNARLNFINRYPNSSVSALVVLNEVGTGKSLEHIKRLYDFLGNDAKKSRYGINVSTKINSIENNLPGNKIPFFKGLDTTGNKLEILDFEADITIIDFWATWCKPCIENFFLLKDLERKYPHKKISIVTSSSDFDFDKWKTTLYKLKIEHWINLYDLRDNNKKNKISKTEMAEFFGVSSLPTTFIIDNKGIIVGRYGGFGGNPIEDLHQKILELLEGDTDKYLN